MGPKVHTDLPLDLPPVQILFIPTAMEIASKNHDLSS
jgi:hypothetical protein